VVSSKHLVAIPLLMMWQLNSRKHGMDHNVPRYLKYTRSWNLGHIRPDIWLIEIRLVAMGVLPNQRQTSAANGTALSANANVLILDIPMYAPSHYASFVLLSGSLSTSKPLRPEYIPQAHPAGISTNWLCFSNLTFIARSDVYSGNLEGRKTMLLVNVLVGKEIELTADGNAPIGVRDYDAARVIGRMPDGRREDKLILYDKDAVEPLYIVVYS